MAPIWSHDALHQAEPRRCESLRPRLLDQKVQPKLERSTVSEFTMAGEFQSLCASLEELALLMAPHTDDRRPAEYSGHWNVTPISVRQLALIPKMLAEDIKANAPTAPTATQAKLAQDLTVSVLALKPTIVPHLYNGYINTALSPFMETMNYVAMMVGPITGWRIIKDRRSLPSSVLQRLQDAESTIDTLANGVRDFDSKVQKIQEAYEAAEELPTTLDKLKHANSTISKTSNEADENFRKILSHNEKIEALIASLRGSQDEASKIVQNCSEAYRITTSIGLAASFDDRATRLNTSIKWWIVGLLSALATVAGIGYFRIDLLIDVIKDPTQPLSMLTFKMILSLLSVSPAIWFAWLATKQIGQRFRMAEDYAFKASVAKAYEGYRREAARIDKKFESHLFESALTRVDESPLRLVEIHSHGSPIHELMKTPEFMSAVQSIPGFGDAVKRVTGKAAKSDKTAGATA